MTNNDIELKSTSLLIKKIECDSNKLKNDNTKNNQLINKNDQLKLNNILEIENINDNKIVDNKLVNYLNKKD